LSPAPSSFSFEPLFVVLAVAAALLYARAARVDRPPWWRAALFGLGLLFVAGALNSPLETIAVNYLLLLLAHEPHAVGAPVKIGYLGAAFVGSAFLGLGLTFASTPFYSFYAEAPRLWGISAEKDQNFGGILMNAEQALVFLAAILYFVVRLLPEEERTSSRA
jgi:cytochrome c oxidase assembly factor CtaG